MLLFLGTFRKMVLHCYWSKSAQINQHHHIWSIGFILVVHTSAGVAQVAELVEICENTHFKEEPLIEKKNQKLFKSHENPASIMHKRETRIPPSLWSINNRLHFIVSGRLPRATSFSAWDSIVGRPQHFLQLRRRAGVRNRTQSSFTSCFLFFQIC